MLKVSVVRVMPVVVLAAVCGIVGGAWVATQRAEVRLAAADARLDALELSVQHRLAPPSAGTSGTSLTSGTREREALVQSVVTRVQREVGLLPVKLVRERRASFVELYATDSKDASNYGTAGYLGDGYFLTVKHGVMALDEGPAASRQSSCASAIARCPRPWSTTATRRTRSIPGTGRS